MILNVTMSTFLLTVFARSLLVRYAEGFVRGGQLDLTLYHQLFWLTYFGFYVSTLPDELEKPSHLKMTISFLFSI